MNASRSSRFSRRGGGRIKNMVTNVISLTSSSRRRNNRQQEEQQFDDSRMCGICLEDFKSGEEICSNNSPDDPCTHLFHADCMLQWLMKNRAEGRCPMCRKIFVSMEEYENRIQFPQQRGDAGTNTSQGNDDERNAAANPGDGD